ncbi:GlsB/YeaQ/YmgE family stress response membrane protein [Paracoccus sp. CPCC 101403]|uniref:GlsB/YeaQ/YmgE family stress response membrane protein n=2 Tax=Paracoccus broussonetiae TaxID=3075834 RepID=A0ABU3E8S8_9RHOB|nr:GlsB/YeaQ/YmgE family stress response membrane protein [Paracoccus sp. CPCC 101403]MDT1060626.1 GlsB/YeaQ/YmgE family stress response membrane protein [Paracoccus sp. CPCC 101403]
MEGLGWIAAIVVGGIAGWIASNIMKADTGIFLNVILGIVGAVVGNAILGVLGLNAQPGSWIAQGFVGLVGAVILIWLYRAVAK